MRIIYIYYCRLVFLSALRIKFPFIPNYKSKLQVTLHVLLESHLRRQIPDVSVLSSGHSVAQSPQWMELSRFL